MGVCFFVGFLTYWRVAGISATVISFGMMCLFGGLANSLAFFVLHRMDSAGYDVGIWRWPRDFKLYAEYWRIAPQKGWSRLTLGGAVFCFLLAGVFLFSIPTLASRDPVTHGPIVDGYKAAACITVSANRRVGGPHTREWETPVILSDGSKVTLVGYQMPGGRITAHYKATGRETGSGNAGDYVYPSDVRFNAQTNLLFVKASGLAGGINHETWVFEFDLLGQRLVERRRVADNTLPTECPESR